MGCTVDRETKPLYFQTKYISQTLNIVFTHRKKKKKAYRSDTNAIGAGIAAIPELVYAGNGCLPIAFCNMFGGYAHTP